MASISQNMCRICENNSKKLIDVSASQYQSLIDKYLSCANVNFDITDELPKYFCEICIDLLNISHNFKEQCEKTYNKLMWQTIDLTSIDEIKQENVVEEETDDFYKKLFDFDKLEASPSNIKIKRINKKIGDSNIFDKNLIKNEFTINEMNKMVKKVEKLLQPQNSKNIQPRKRYPKKLSSKTYECYMCKDHTYKAKQPLISHMEIKHKFGINDDEIIIHKCDICNKIYSCRTHLIRHYKNIHLNSDKPKVEIPCEICGKLFSSAANQRRHFREIHKKEKPHECKMCGNRFSQLTVLQTHLKTHFQVNGFKCNQCDEVFNTKIDIENHLNVHFSKEEIPIQLDQLCKQQTSNCVNKICEICGKSMTHRQLFYHMAKHGVKMHECKVCLKKFADKNRLAVHNLSHTGERPHQCDRCPKAFRQWAHLYEHLKTHTGDKPNKCRFCEKAFSMAGNLREHERIHTGETPYSCNLCTQRFTNLKALRRHAKSVHPENEAAAVTTKSRGEILNILSVVDHD